MSEISLGFGTAPMLGRLGARPSRRAVEHAFDAGVRHFDTARSYGWGEAEALLAASLASRARASYRLVTKCGIVPARRSRWLGTAKTIARHVFARIPASRALIRRVASTPQFSPTRTYDVAMLSDSFRASLSELRTDYVDVLLLHSFDPSVEGLGPVVDWLRGLVREGRIHRFGFSVESNLIEGLTYLQREGFLEGAVVQAPVSDAMLSLPNAWQGVPFFAHSPFRYLTEGTRGGAGTLSELLVRLAQSSRCEAVVASMFSLPHIDANVRALSEAVHLSAQTGHASTRGVS